MMILKRLALTSLFVGSPAFAGATFDFTADIYGRTASSGQLAAGTGTHTVLDLYLTSTSSSDLRVLSLYNLTIALGDGGFVHDDGGTESGGDGNWSASYNILGGVTAIDSFVTLGAMSGSDPFAATLDPNFDGSVAASVSSDAGWYNSDPSSGQGDVDGGGRVMVGRFVILNDLASDTTFSVSGDFSYNFQQPGVFFDDDSQVFTLPASSGSVVPGPTGLIATAAFGLVGRRRRR